jgi:hypothetical protein
MAALSMAFGKRTHDQRVVHDERWLIALRLYLDLDQLIDQLLFIQCFWSQMPLPNMFEFPNELVSQLLNADLTSENCWVNA